MSERLVQTLTNNLDRLIDERDKLKAENERLKTACEKEFADAQKWSDECAKLKAELEHVRGWYGSRYERLSDWARENLPGDKKHEFFNILANGVADVHESNTYQGHLNNLKNELDRAQKACAEMRNVLEACDIYLAGASQPTNRALIRHALSSDCGKDYVHKNRIRCMYCDKEYSLEQSAELADHIMSCDKSPLVQMVREMESRIVGYMDLMNDEFVRIVGITDNAEVVGICQRAMTIILQNVPVIKQRDDAQKECYRLNSEVERLREALKVLLEESKLCGSENWEECECPQCSAMRLAKSALEKEAR